MSTSTATLLAILVVWALAADEPKSPEPQRDPVVHTEVVAQESLAVEPAASSTSPTTDDLAEQIIQCESGGRNVEIIDSNGKWSRGIAQFQDSTWEWLSGLAGIEGSPLEPEKARAVLIWALENGYGFHWSCFRIVLTQNQL